MAWNEDPAQSVAAEIPQIAACPVFSSKLYIFQSKTMINDHKETLIIFGTMCSESLRDVLREENGIMWEKFPNPNPK